METVPGVVDILGKPPMPPRTPIDGALFSGTGIVLGRSPGAGLGTNTAGVKSVGFPIAGRAFFE